ncbi:MAG: ATP-binding cassette domain-containing protein [Glaciecola sp.]
MLQINDLDYHYQHLQIFAHLNMGLTGPRHCISGANGLGKSTLLTIIAQLQTPSRGSVLLHGKSVSASQVALASDSISFPPFLSAADILKTSADMYQCDWPIAIVEGFRFVEHIHKRVDELSAGNLKKLQLINALMRQCEVLLVDEPNIALDASSLAFMWSVFNDYSGMIVAATNEPALFVDKGYVVTDLNTLVQHTA